MPLFALRVPGVTMQTTALAGETIGGLYEGARLGDALREARARTLAIYADVDLEQPVPQLALVNPPLWELAHIAWFQEHWCLRWSREAGTLRAGSRLEGADTLFDSARVAHATRWSLPYPPAATLRAYMEATLEETLRALATTPEDQRYFFALSLLHEDMHGEALLMTLQTLAWPAPRIEDVAAGKDSRYRAAADVTFEGGEFEQGSRPDSRRFVFDNEKWAHPRRVDPFRMADRPVTQGEFAAFVDDSGYAREEIWSASGWRWLRENRVGSPIHWRHEEGAWQARRYDGWHPIEADAAMCHVCLHEAQAYCRWAGRRCRRNE